MRITVWISIIRESGLSVQFVMAQEILDFGVGFGVICPSDLLSGLEILSMKINDYQEHAHYTAEYPTDKMNLTPAQVYTLMGLAGEAGELANLCKKAQRGDFGDDPMSAADFTVHLVTELGGVAWYLAEVCTAFGLYLDEVLEDNLELLADRQKRGVIKGSGDDR